MKKGGRKMADRVKDRGKAATQPGGILTAGQTTTMKGPVYRDVDHTPKYRGGSSNPKPSKNVVVG